MKPEKKHEATEPEVVELRDEQLEKIAGGQNLGLCYTCGLVLPGSVTLPPKSRPDTRGSSTARSLLTTRPTDVDSALSR